MSLVNEILSSDILPKGFLPLLKNLEFKTGALDLNCRIVNNNVNANADLGGISFVYLPLELPVEIINGATAIKNNTLKLYKINILADDKIREVLDKNVYDSISSVIKSIINFNKISFENYIDEISKSNCQKYGKEKTLVIMK